MGYFAKCESCGDILTSQKDVFITKKGKDYDYHFCCIDCYQSWRRDKR